MIVAQNLLFPSRFYVPSYGLKGIITISFPIICSLYNFSLGCIKSTTNTDKDVEIRIEIPLIFVIESVHSASISKINVGATTMVYQEKHQSHCFIETSWL